MDTGVCMMQGTVAGEHCACREARISMLCQLLHRSPYGGAIAAKIMYGLLLDEQFAQRLSERASLLDVQDNFAVTKLPNYLKLVDPAASESNNCCLETETLQRRLQNK